MSMILMAGTVLIRIRLVLEAWEVENPLVAAAAQAMVNHRQGRRLPLGALPQVEMLPVHLFREEGRCLQQRHHSGRLLKLRTPKTSL